MAMMRMNATLPKQVESAPGATTFDVHYSDPAPSARLRAQPRTYWKLGGRGQLTINEDHVVLSGRRSRFLWIATPEELSFSLKDIVNVVREGRIVQFHIRIQGGGEKPLNSGRRMTSPRSGSLKGSPKSEAGNSSNCW